MLEGTFLIRLWVMKGYTQSPTVPMKNRFSLWMVTIARARRSRSASLGATDISSHSS